MWDAPTRDVDSTYIYPGLLILHHYHSFDLDVGVGRHLKITNHVDKSNKKGYNFE